MKKGCKIIIDVDWERYMAEKEIKSLVQQCMYSYSLNRNSTDP